jgi:hypothetical protein
MTRVRARMKRIGGTRFVDRIDRMDRMNLNPVYPVHPV